MALRIQYSNSVPTRFGGFLLGITRLSIPIRSLDLFQYMRVTARHSSHCPLKKGTLLQRTDPWLMEGSQSHLRGDRTTTHLTLVQDDHEITIGFLCSLMAFPGECLYTLGSYSFIAGHQGCFLNEPQIIGNIA